MTAKEKPIRILHVVTYMGRGGLETMLMNYYRNIDRNKIQFDFLTHREFEADYDREIKELGGRIYHLPRLNPFHPEYLKQLDQFFKEHKEYKIIHSHLDCMAGIPLKYAKKNRVPVRIAHAHNSDQTKDIKYFLKLCFKQNITRYATHLFACSRDAGRWMFGTDQFQVLNNAIDAEKYVYDRDVRNRVRKEWGIGNGTMVFGHVGRFSAQKNHVFLIDIFAEVTKREPDSRLLLIGDGELQGAIKKKCHEAGFDDKIIFTGVREDVPELLQAMDVFLFPSLFEGLPLVMIEAQAAGMPCLVSEGVPLECEKTEGLVYQLKLESGADCWAEKALQCTHKKRSNTLEQIRKSGFDIKEAAIKLQEFYLEVYHGKR